MRRVVKTKSTKDILCNYCCLEFPTCPKANYIKFGDGVGNDNVIECSEYSLRRQHHNYPIEATDKLVARVDLNSPNRQEGK